MLRFEPRKNVPTNLKHHFQKQNQFCMLLNLFACFLGIPFANLEDWHYLFFWNRECYKNSVWAEKNNERLQRASTCQKFMKFQECNMIDTFNLIIENIWFFVFVQWKLDPFYNPIVSNFWPF